jgi:hypothetical protein
VWLVDWPCQGRPDANCFVLGLGSERDGVAADGKVFMWTKAIDRSAAPLLRACNHNCTDDDGCVTVVARTSRRGSRDRLTSRGLGTWNHRKGDAIPDVPCQVGGSAPAMEELALQDCNRGLASPTCVRD